MLINFTNHPVKHWQKNQIDFAIKKYKKVIDLPFPDINPNSSTQMIQKNSNKYLLKFLNILKNSSDKNNAVHIMGEHTFTYNLVLLLKQNNIKCIASTSSRIVFQKGNIKTVKFNFIRFREY